MSVYSKSQKDNVIGAELQSILGGGINGQKKKIKT